jgi:hypothetical protein
MSKKETVMPPDKPEPWTVERLQSNVHKIRFKDIAEGWEQRVMLSGDRHHDNKHADHKLEIKHLEQAKQCNAPIIDIGDFFCLMQGKYDPRKNYTDLRPELIEGPYLDRVIDTAADFYKPYAEQFAVIGEGNHEANIKKRRETDMIARITEKLQRASKIENRAFAGGYSGWVLFTFHASTASMNTLALKYHHGYGGGGPVTRGVIQTNRRAVYLPDAAIIVTGHIHEAWSVPIKRERITQRGVVRQDLQWHVSVPTYKDDYRNGEGGYHIENGRPPKPMGCVWLILRYENKRVTAKIELDLI